jgi:hypothetical protein
MMIHGGLGSSTSWDAAAHCAAQECAAQQGVAIHGGR